MVSAMGLVRRPVRILRRVANYIQDVSGDRVPNVPAILHITHWKAGSQWIRCILESCCPRRIVKPSEHYDHLLQAPIRAGLIYPTVYATREALQELTFPSNVRRFVVIRDPRDAVISLYFSDKISHRVGPVIARRRNLLQSLSVEDGLCFLIPESTGIARIIHSWLGAGDPLIRYEDLLRDDEAILERVLLDHCQLPVSRKHLLAAIRAHRFEQLTGGRPRGQEDVQAHERKGVAGDWRNYFTDRVKEVFKRFYGTVLVEAGYERDQSW